MDRPWYVNLDRPNGRQSNGPPILRQFGPSKITVVDRYFGPLKKMVVDRTKLRLGTVILDRKNVNKKIKNYKNCGEGGGQYNRRTTRSCIIRPYDQATGLTQ